MSTSLRPHPRQLTEPAGPTIRAPASGPLAPLGSDDVNLRTDVLRGLAELLIALQGDHPLRVAVDGITASGKTTLGKRTDLRHS